MKQLQVSYHHIQDPDATMTLYAIVCGPYVKVGITSNPEQRAQTIAALNPYPLKVLLTKEVPRLYARAIETEVHKRLAEYHHRSEWFVDVPPAKLRRIVARCALIGQQLLRETLEHRKAYLRSLPMGTLAEQETENGGLSVGEISDA